ncbi:leucine-rich receptor-like protein kinase family protein [Wolffia australiana]
MASPLPLLLFLFLISFPTTPARASAMADDLRSLLEFKKGIRDDPSGLVLSSWKESLALAQNRCPTDWHGVVCEDDDGVIAVALNGLALSGEVKFSTLVGMRNLRNFSLSGNNLTGRLVPMIGSMGSLQHLDLSGNQFYGPVPPRITDLWGLVHLNLSRNGFEGRFPGGLGSLQQLRVLDLSFNSLDGDVKEMLSELRNVEILDLSNNGFYGSLAVDAVNLTSLGNTAKIINLSFNRIGGGFFLGDALPSFKNLETLDVSNNRLSGELPSFDSLYNLRVLRASWNLLSGHLPQGLFGSSAALLELDLSGNGFTGQIFNINSTSLKVLNLSSNLLSGSLPAQIGACQVLDLSMNMVSGDLSSIQSWGSTIEVIDLSSNALSGEIPSSIFHFEGLTYLKMRNNSLVGSLPSASDIGRQLSDIDLSSNKLTGPLPPSLFLSLALTYLNLSENQFSGILPIQAPHSTESLVLPSVLPLEFLDLSSNSLSGPLPPEISEFQKLKYIELGKNSLSGGIPAELSNLINLEFLDLSMNSFKGKIPNLPQASLKRFNVSYNDLSGVVPESLRKFGIDAFHPGNALLILPGGRSGPQTHSSTIGSPSEHRQMKSRILIAIIFGSVGAVVLIFFIFMAVYMIATQELCGKKGFRDYAAGRFSPSSIFRFHKHDVVQSSMSFSNDHLLNSTSSRTLPAQKDSTISETAEIAPSNTREVDAIDQAVVLDVYSPDRLAGDLFYLDKSLTLTAEDLSRAPAEVLGRSSHGTSYKATLDDGHVLTVKWLRVGLVKRKNEFSKEVKKIGSIRHPNIVPLRSFYWGLREQERLLLSDYIHGDSLALHLHESTPRRHSPLTAVQRLKISTDIARGLVHLHQDRGLAHGNLKPANVLLTGSDLTARLTDYGLHRLMTPAGTREQMLNLSALGYSVPELAQAPSPKGDVYALGVILMELLTRRSAEDIISGQSGAVDLADWVRMCVREGRACECYDRDVVPLTDQTPPPAMDRLLGLALRCVLPASERPTARAVLEELCSVVV